MVFAGYVAGSCRCDAEEMGARSYPWWCCLALPRGWHNFRGHADSGCDGRTAATHAAAHAAQHQRGGSPDQSAREVLTSLAACIHHQHAISNIRLSHPLCACLCLCVPAYGILLAAVQLWSWQQLHEQMIVVLSSTLRLMLGVTQSDCLLGHHGQSITTSTLDFGQNSCK